MNHSYTWTTAFAIALLLTTSYMLDEPDDHSTENAIAVDLEDAQRMQDAELRRDMAAAKQCREEHGESGFTWTVDNRLVCIPRRGRKVAAL